MSIRSKYDYDPDEPFNCEPYAVNLPKGVCCPELTATSEVGDLVSDFMNCGYMDVSDLHGAYLPRYWYTRP